jgi:hypothetical protein
MYILQKIRQPGRFYRKSGGVLCISIVKISYKREKVKEVKFSQLFPCVLCISRSTERQKRRHKYRDELVAEHLDWMTRATHKNDRGMSGLTVRRFDEENEVIDEEKIVPRVRLIQRITRIIHNEFRQARLRERYRL